MAINSGRISAGPTKERAGLKTTRVPLTNNIPPSFSSAMVDGQLVITEQSPKRHGEVVVYHDGANVTTMYVAIEVVPGFLEWKEASISMGFIDSTTGKPFGL